MFRLAHELKMTVKELSLTMGASELAEWVAYFEILSEREAK